MLNLGACPDFLLKLTPQSLQESGNTGTLLLQYFTVQFVHLFTKIDLSFLNKSFFSKTNYVKYLKQG